MGATSLQRSWRARSGTRQSCQAWTRHSKSLPSAICVLLPPPPSTPAKQETADQESHPSPTPLADVFSECAWRLQEARETEKFALELLKNRALLRGEIPDARYEGKTEAELAFIDAMELLMFGANEDNVTMIRQAVALGADVNGRAPELRNETALHAACSMGKGYINVVKVLLELGADPNAVNVNNNTALHEAAYWAHKVLSCQPLSLLSRPHPHFRKGRMRQWCSVAPRCRSRVRISTAKLFSCRVCAVLSLPSFLRLFCFRKSTYQY